MNSKALNINKKRTAKAVCFGSGLVALDVIMNGNPNTDPRFVAGGSCGNVIAILSYLGWESYPIARLSKSHSTNLLLDDLRSHDVRTNLITQTSDGSTPIIIHRILKDKDNNPKHRYEFRIPKTNTWFPSYKPVLSNKVEEITNFPIIPKVFYLDRISRATVDLATYYKSKGALIFFEPSSISDDKQFKECLAVADVLKFSNDRLPEFKDKYPARQVPVEIETLGANGLLFRSYKNKNDEWHFLPAIYIDQAMDNAGAGDWCSAGFIHAMHQSFENSIFQDFTVLKLQTAIQFGQFLSALNCNFYGARGLMYNMEYKCVVEAYHKYEIKKRVEVKKTEPGFALRTKPFEFKHLMQR